MASLVAVSARYRDSFMDAIAEFTREDEALAFERQLALKDFDRYVELTDAWIRGEQLPDGWIACTSLWLIDDDQYIGSVNIRHELNDWLLRWGGHIGYAIRPSRRRMGYGTEICRLALNECRTLGLRLVLITCDADNVGSRKIIEANDGVFEDEVPQSERDVPKRRYWIDVGMMDP